MVTPAERLEWVIEQSGSNPNALSLKGGLARQHLSTLLARMRKDPQAGFDMKTAQALQHVTGVSLDWLVSERGPRLVEDHVEYEGARYPNLEAAIELMRAKVLDDSISRARSIAMHYPSDLSVGEWVDELQRIDRLTRRQAKTGDADEGRLLDDEDDTPPAGRE